MPLFYYLSFYIVWFKRIWDSLLLMCNMICGGDFIFVILFLHAEGMWGQNCDHFASLSKVKSGDSWVLRISCQGNSVRRRYVALLFLYTQPALYIFLMQLSVVNCECLMSLKDSTKWNLDSQYCTISVQNKAYYHYRKSI